MSGATYRIETEHDPADGIYVPWKASVYRVSDNEHLKTLYGANQERAEQAARQFVDLLDHKQPGRTFYVFDDGTDAPAPESHSVKA